MPAGQKRRQEGGGRSVRYSKRRAQRGTVGSCAPRWTDGAALAVQRQVQELTSHRPDLSAANQLGVILSATVEVELFMTSLRMGPNDTVSARAVLLWHAARLANVPCPRERFKCCQNISRVLRERTRGMPASAKAPPPRPSRAPLSPSPRKMTKHVAGAAKANEEERERAKGRAFSTEEDVTLRKARWQPGWTWKEITSQLPGRSERATRDRWTRTLCEALQPRQLDRQQQPQTPKQRTVRFECDGCGKRLKAKVPAGVGRFRTKCSDCGKWLEKVPQDLQAQIATHLPHTPEYVTPRSS